MSFDHAAGACDGVVERRAQAVENVADVLAHELVIAGPLPARQSQGNRPACGTRFR
jgi:hypothetical protein